jgi:flagellar biosynthesis/type III secretory pathway protein FliH
VEPTTDTIEALAAEREAESGRLSTYAPTPYVDEHWTVLNVGEAKQGFMPLELAAVSAAVPQVDPMFEDYTSQVTARFIVGGQGSPGAVAAERQSQDESFAPYGEDSLVQHSGGESQEDGDVVVVQAPGVDPEEHQRAIEEARASAFAEAREATQADANARVEALEARFSATLEDLKTQVAESVAAAEERAAELALSVARKLMGAAAESSPDYLKSLLKEAIAAAGNAEIRRIKVSPQDYEALKALPRESLGAGSAAGWTFEPDESIHIGCVLVTAAGEVDFNLDKAWERIRKQALNPVGATDE